MQEPQPRCRVQLDDVYIDVDFQVVERLDVEVCAVCLADAEGQMKCESDSHGDFRIDVQSQRRDTQVEVEWDIKLQDVFAQLDVVLNGVRVFVDVGNRIVVDQETLGVVLTEGPDNDVRDCHAGVGILGGIFQPIQVCRPQRVEQGLLDKKNACAGSIVGGRRLR